MVVGSILSPPFSGRMHSWSHGILSGIGEVFINDAIGEQFGGRWEESRRRDLVAKGRTAP